MQVVLKKNFLKIWEPCPEAMVESALNHVILEDNDYFEFKISCKASDVFQLLQHIMEYLMLVIIQSI